MVNAGNSLQTVLGVVPPLLHLTPLLHLAPSPPLLNSPEYKAQAGEDAAAAAAASEPEAAHDEAMDLALSQTFPSLKKN